MNQLLKVSLRQKAVFVPVSAITADVREIRETTGLLAANLSKLGYGVSEELLRALNNTSPAFQAEVLTTVKDITGVNKNWTPLVKGWNVPTGESLADHMVTFFATIFEMRGTRLPCGHIIPNGTFPLDRYNGCPFCGTPFEFGAIENYKQGSEQKVLDLWGEQEVKEFLCDLLRSKTALDATQMDSLNILLGIFPIPDVSIGMKETVVAVIDIYRSQNAPEKAQALLKSPADVLRYLWYKHTGFLQIIEPKTIAARKKANHNHLAAISDTSVWAKLKAIRELKLKYSRKDCLMVASWLNKLEPDTATMCEIMHPKRGMWVRFIRALRLAEYSKRPGFEKLKDLLDKFYNEEYAVWQGKVNESRLRADKEVTLTLLQQRPGLFARSLFANMLWFGAEDTVQAFVGIIDKVPARLVFTLYMYAENYFDKKSNRTVKPLGGVSKQVAPNALLELYDSASLERMRSAVANLCVLSIKQRFAAIATTSQTMYIDPMLFKIPVSIGERSENVQDLPTALMGTRFPIKGNSVRLFMQWGMGMKAQHLDMDLSCSIAYPNMVSRCSYSSMTVTGAQHSGDVRSIPHKVGTAEYIELDIPVLKAAGATYVTFTCNAYSEGAISPNLIVGWMNSDHPMKISATTGVAYDPSCVQHQVRVVNSLTKGLVFGVLDVARNEIIWLEMPFSGQIVQQLDNTSVALLIKKLDSRLTIGQLLVIKAAAQGLQLIDSEQVDEAYTLKWAQNTAAVTKLLVD